MYMYIYITDPFNIFQDIYIYIHNIQTFEYNYLNRR